MSDINITVNDEIVNIDVLDTPVYVEVTNSPGQQGPAGVGVPVGGTTGQVLSKASATNYDTVWVNASGGGVPYSGATGNVNLGEYELKAGQLTLDVSPTGTAAVGTTRWNDTTGVSETTLKGGNVLLRNGVDLVARVVNKVTPNTTLTKAAYQAVRVSGAQGQRLAVAFAQANNDANSADTIGLVIETIPTNQEGFIMAVGQIENINTTGSLQGETWVDGDVLYLSPTTAGRLTNIKPTGATGHIVVIGYVEYAHANNGKIYVKIMNGWELDELHNVYISSVANNEALIYESATQLWKNKTIASALGYTPVTNARLINTTSPLVGGGDLSADRTISIPAATSLVSGHLTATDWNTFNNKVGGTGATGQVAYWNGTNSQTGDNNLVWNAASIRLGIGRTSTARRLEIQQGVGGIASALGIYKGDGTLPFIMGIESQSTDDTILAATVGIRFYTGSTIGGAATLPTNERMRLYGATGNLVIGGTFASDGGQRLQVYGDTLLRGSGATSATNALTVQNSSSTNLLTVRNDGAVAIGAANYNDGLRINRNPTLASSTSNLVNVAIQNTVNVFYSAYRTSIGLFGSGFTLPNLIHYECINDGSFTAGVVTNLYGFKESFGTYVATNVYGFYGAIPAASGRWSLYMAGTADNYLAGDLGIGTTSVTNWLNIAASTTAKAHMNLASGVAPTAPANGDIWFDGTDIKMRIGGVTKTFTLI